MPQVNYVFARQTFWREFAWQPGDKLIKSDLPPDLADILIRQLVEDGNVVPKDEFDPPRQAAPEEPEPTPRRKAKE